MIGKKMKWLSFAVLLVAGPASYGGMVTPAEVAQIEAEFGIVLSTNQVAELNAVVNPAGPSQWLIDAESRIDVHRKVDLDVQVVDMNGTPVEGAMVSVKMRSNDFKFGGTFSARDFAGNTNTDKIDTTVYKQRLLSMFNAVGLNNGFKPRLTGIHQYVPGVLSWAQANELPVRGHLLIWPGNGDLGDLDDPSAELGADYGSHLSSSSTSDYAHYNVRGAVETYKNSDREEADKNDLKAVVDAEIAEWAGRWNVYEWDVINETLSNHLLQDILGQEQMAEWFKIGDTNKVSADTKMLINEFQIISAMSESLTPGWYTDRRDRYMTNINQIISDGGQIDRIGFQSRIKSERRDPQLIYDRLEEWGNAYGLGMVGTEFEIVDSDPDATWKTYWYTDEERAQITHEMMTQYFSHPLVTGLNAWNAIHDENKALVDYYGNPTQNGLVWYYMHRIRYSTDATLAANPFGETGLRAFKGDYDVTVTYGGVDYPVDLTLSNDQSFVVVLDGVTIPANEVNLVDAWYYDGLTNGSALSSATSTGLVGGISFNDDDLAMIENQAVRWMADGVDPSAFRITAPSSSLGATNGRYQLSVDYLDADFAGTAADANGDARIGFGIRSNATTSNDVMHRLYFVSGGGTDAEFRLQVSDSATGLYQTVASFPGSTLDHLHVRTVYDLDTRGSADSFALYYSLDGAAEVAAYTEGVLHSDFELDQLKLVVQTINGGANWVAGDKVYTDNLALTALGAVPEPPPITSIVLEEWTMTGGVDGAQLNTVPSTTGTGSTLGGTQANGQDIQGEQIRIFSAGTGAGFGSISDASYAGATSGVYEISFDITAADLSLTSLSNGSAQAGFGFRFNDGSNRDLRTLFRYNGAAASDEFRLVVSTAGDGNQNITIKTGAVLSAVLNVRQVLDMDAGTYSVYYTLGAAAEVEAYSGGVFAGQTIDSLRQQFQPLNGGNSMQVGDAIYMDDVSLYLIVEGAITPESLLADWLADYPSLGGETNLTDNLDQDAADNLLEYAFGGDPANALDVGTWPEFQTLEANGTNYIEYVYTKRNDAEARGLGYQLETTPDLIGGTWTNSGFIFMGEGELNAEFESVTNRLPATDGAGFIRLKVEYAP